MPSSGYFQCPICCCDVVMVPVKKAAGIVGVSNSTIYLWARQERIHVNRIAGGQIRICQPSLVTTSQNVNGSASIPPTDVRIKLAIKIIDEQYSHADPTLGKLAKQLGLSIYYLARLFKKNAGLGFREYLRKLRLKKAEELLQVTALSIKEVAAAIGYKHVSDFDHHFKAAYGMRPSEYRRFHLRIEARGESRYSQ